MTRYEDFPDFEADKNAPNPADLFEDLPNPAEESQDVGHHPADEKFEQVAELDVLGFSNNDDVLSGLEARLAEMGIYGEKYGEKKTHPTVIDLASGIGSLAIQLTKLGWDPEKIVCNDRDVPQAVANEIKKSDWLIGDLNELLEALTDNQPVHPKFEKYRGKFSMLVAAQTPWDLGQMMQLAEFFLDLNERKEIRPPFSDSNFTIIARA